MSQKTRISNIATTDLKSCLKFVIKRGASGNPLWSGLQTTALKTFVVVNSLHHRHLLSEIHFTCLTFWEWDCSSLWITDLQYTDNVFYLTFIIRGSCQARSLRDVSGSSDFILRKRASDTV